MGIDEELQKQGYEFDLDRSERETPAEIWINKKAGLGIRLARAAGRPMASP